MEALLLKLDLPALSRGRQTSVPLPMPMSKTSVPLSSLSKTSVPLSCPPVLSMSKTSVPLSPLSPLSWTRVSGNRTPRRLADRGPAGASGAVK